MKYFKTLCLAVFSLFVMSCDSDDDNGTALNNTSLAGTYNVTAFSASGSDSSTFNGTTETETFTAVGSDFNDLTITFTESGLVSSTGTFTVTTTYTEDGMSDVDTETSDLELGGTYSISGDSLIFSGEDTVDVTIRNFSNNGFEMFFVENEVDSSGSYQAEGSYTLVRQ